jgi:hypothetical protein
MKISVGEVNFIEKLKDARHPDIRRIPEKFSGREFSPLERDRFCVPSSPIKVQGISTFGSHPMEITLNPYEEARRPNFLVNGSPIPLHIEAVRRGFIHSIALENDQKQRVEIIEHIASLIGVFRLR